MANVKINLNLTGGRDERGIRHYEPGEPLRGTVTLTPDGDVTCNHAYIRLQWQTQGRGTRYEAKAAELDFYQGTLRANHPSHHEFTLPLPTQPWSYEGHYVSIAWEVMVQIDVPWAVDPKLSQPIALLPKWKTDETPVEPNQGDYW